MLYAAVQKLQIRVRLWIDKMTSAFRAVYLSVRCPLLASSNNQKFQENDYASHSKADAISYNPSQNR